MVGVHDVGTYECGNCGKEMPEDAECFNCSPKYNQGEQH